MIEVKTLNVFGLSNAIESMRNPYESYDKSDSFIECDMISFIIGEEDMKLCKKLIRGGSEHRKFLRMIHVQAEVKAPLYWWKEFDTYKVGTVANSSSTMHLIHKRDLTLDDFSHDHLNPLSKVALKQLLISINAYRQSFVNSKCKNKNCWWQIIQLLPSSYNQLRTIDLNYETLFTIYRQRKNHKLDEWIEFCKWIESLPYMKEFLNYEDK